MMPICPGGAFNYYVRPLKVGGGGGGRGEEGGRGSIKIRTYANRERGCHIVRTFAYKFVPKITNQSRLLQTINLK